LKGDGWLEGWVDKLVAHLIATTALWIRIQTSLKNTKRATEAKEVPTHSRPQKKTIKSYGCQEWRINFSY
jgi:hypothetical protein